MNNEKGEDTFGLTEGKASSVDGAEIAYTSAGNGRPPLLFVHGAFGNQGHWHNQLAALSALHSVVTVDLAGHGRSTAGGRQAFTMESFARDVAAVIAHLELNDVILVGHSMGGAVILEAARLMPERIAGLVGVDTFVYPPYQGLKEEQITSGRESRLNDYNGMVLEIYRSNFGSQADRNMVERIAQEALQVELPVGVSELEELLRWDVGETLAAVTTPVFCIFQSAMVGAHVPTELTGKFDAAYVGDCGHFIMLEAPEKFNESLQQAVDALRTS